MGFILLFYTYVMYFNTIHLTDHPSFFSHLLLVLAKKISLYNYVTLLIF
jgi:hypothetical protein